MPAGTVATNRYYAAAAPPPVPQVGVWDQWCVLSDRAYSKEGDLSLMDEAACRMFLENFRRSPDDLPCNVSHDKAQVVGSYNAMALFVGGQCVDFATHDQTVPAPTIADLPRGDDGSPPDDGIYWRRARLTELGLTSGPYLRKVSPEFYMRGKNQFEEEVGPLAVGGAWTNYPFLPGCEKHEFEREPAMKKTFAARCYEEAGIKDDNDESKYSRLRSYFRGKHGGAEYAKYEDEAGVGKDDDDMTAMGKMMPYMAGRESMQQMDVDPSNQAQNAAIHLKTGNVHDRDGEKMEKMTGPSVSGTAPPAVDGGEPNKDPVPGPAPASMERGKSGMVQMTAERAAMMEAGLQQLGQLSRRVQEFEAAQKAEKTRGEATEFTQVAWRRGQIIPRKTETHAQAQTRILQLYTRSGKQAAEDALAPEGSFVPPEAMGAPLQHYSADRPPTADRPDDEILNRAYAAMEKAGIEDPRGVKTGRPSPRLLEFCRQVTREDQRLARAWAEQSKTAFQPQTYFGGAR